MAHNARLDKKQEDGSTLREHYEAAHRRGRLRDPERLLFGPEPPSELRYLLGWWRELGWGLGQSVTWADVDAWARLTDRKPYPHEVRALVQMELARRDPGNEPDEE